MDVYYVMSYGSALWQLTQSAALLASPTLIVTMLSPEVREPSSMLIISLGGPLPNFPIQCSFLPR